MSANFSDYAILVRIGVLVTNRRATLSIATVLAVVLVAATASPAVPSRVESTRGLTAATAHDVTQVAPDYFETPSRNIACGWFADIDRPSRAYLRCEIISLLSPMPKRPASCDVDWGYGMSMASTGPASVLCAGDTVRRTGNRSVLAYGSTWRKRGFTCASAAIGLTCRNTSGHGLFLSRERWRRF
jgi:hypothetical protein